MAQTSYRLAQSARGAGAERGSSPHAEAAGRSRRHVAQWEDAEPGSHGVKEVPSPVRPQLHAPSLPTPGVCDTSGCVSHRSRAQSPKTAPTPTYFRGQPQVQVVPCASDQQAVSQAPTARSWGPVSLLEQFTELGKTFYL